MTNKLDKIDIICDYWVNLITDAIVNSGAKLKYYENNLDNFRYELEDYLYFCYPKTPKSPMIDLNCIGTPNYLFRGIFDKAGISPNILKGNILQMEITYNDVKLYDRKANTCEVLYTRKSPLEIFKKDKGPEQ